MSVSSDITVLGLTGMEVTQVDATFGEICQEDWRFDTTCIFVLNHLAISINI